MPFLQKHLRGKHLEEARKAFGDGIDKDTKKQSFMSCFTNTRKCCHSCKRTYFGVRDLRPLSDQGFKQLLNYIEPNYRVPSRPHITSICQKLICVRERKTTRKTTIALRYVTIRIYYLFIWQNIRISKVWNRFSSNSFTPSCSWNEMRLLTSLTPM